MDYEDVKVFENFSLSIPENKITCIIGPSGSGKTSILNILAGLVTDYKGKVYLGDDFSYIFQESRLIPFSTVYDNIKIVRRDEDKDEILAILNDLGLLGFENKYPDQLSGGMKQRVSIARGFYYNSSILLMDEPFKSIDYDLRINLINYLKYIYSKNNKTIIFITHDIDEAILLGHHIIVLSNRPTVIKKEFVVESDILKRTVLDKEHISLRSQIIDMLSKE